MDIDFPLTDDFSSDIGNVNRIFQELNGEADRGVVLVVAAFLDEQLEVLLTRHFISDSKAAEELLSTNGPLGSFSSRIKLAYCLDLIHRQLYLDLQTVRKIRNEFAHSHTPADFNSDRVRDLCANLKFMDLVPGLQDETTFADVFKGPGTIRNQFIAHVMALFWGLTFRINMSTSGQIDAIRFVERDIKATGGQGLQKLFDEMDMK